MIKFTKGIKGGFVMLFCIMILSGCGTSELVEEHINDPLAASGEVAYYANMNADDRKALCVEKHIEVSGVVTKDGSFLLYLGDKKEDGIEISCSFDDKIEDVVEGDIVTLDGVCNSSFDDAMFLYGCRISECIKKEESKTIPLDKLNEDTSNLIKAPIASYECEGKKYNEIEKIFQDAGFTVVLTPVEQTVGEAEYEDGDVIIVATEKQSIFEQDEEIPASEEILVRYCLLTNVTEEVVTAPTYNITDTTETLFASSEVNVRSGPDKNSTKIGTLSQNDEVVVTGNVDNGWYRINFGGNEGYVKGDYLSNERIVVAESASIVQVDSTPVTSVGTTNSGISGNTSGNDDGSSGNSNDSSGSSGTSGVIVPITEDTQGNLVWVPTNGGKKYHIGPSCSQMEDPMQVTKEHAEANGYTPCKKCYK